MTPPTAPHHVIPAQAGIHERRPPFDSCRLASMDSRLRGNDEGGRSLLGVTLTLPLILLARFWQIGPSRLIPPSCRYTPSCSAYAIQAWRRYGALKGSWLAGRRLLRCHPWGGCGHDPLP